MKHTTLKTAMAMAAAMNLGGCVGAPVDPSDTTDQALTISPTPIPAPALACELAPEHAFTGASVQAVLSALNSPVDLSTPFTVSFNTAPGTCFFDAAEAGAGVRVGGQFRITSPVALHNNVTGSVVADGTGADPYLYRVHVDVGTVTFASIGDVDISTNCVALDRPLTGTIPNLAFDVDLAAPTVTRTHFVVRRVTPTFGAVTVVNPDAAIAWFTPVCAVADHELATASVRAMLANTIAASVSGAPAIADLPMLVDIGFGGETGWRAGDTMCSDAFAASCAGGVACGQVKYH